MKQCLLRGIFGHVERLPEYISSIQHNGISYKLNNCGQRSVETHYTESSGNMGEKNEVVGQLCP